MPTIIWNNEEERERHNERSRKAMAKYYHNKGGKIKTLLKYYKKKFIDDAEAMEIYNNPNLDLEEKLKQLKIYNVVKKMKSTN
jgi:hypothetical protein